MKPLSSLKPGETGRVQSVHGGRNFVQRLAEMGVLCGAKLTVVRSGGPVIVRLGFQRLMFGRGVAHRIYVQTGTQPEPSANESETMSP